MERPKALGFLGGSFDPIHKGHLHLAQAVRRAFALDKIYLIPNAHPPHKDGNFSSYADRTQMSRLALQSLNVRQYQISLLEHEELHCHYTYDTLKLLRERFGEAARLYFIMGLDSLLALDTWHRGLELTDFANLVVLKRPGYELEEGAVTGALKDYLQTHLCREDSPEFKQVKYAPLGWVFLLSAPEVDVSSTSLRAELAALSAAPDGSDEELRHELRSMVSAPVLRYISAHQLYKTRR